MGSKKRLAAPIKLISALIAIAILAVIAYLVFFNTGTLEINSTPTDATVYVNEKPASKTVKLSTGQYQIKIAKDGYVAVFKTVKITGGITTKISPYLKTLPQPTQVADNANFITRYGNNVYYLANNTLFKQSSGQAQQITPSTLTSIKKLVLLPDEQNALFLTADNKLFFYEFRRYDLVNQVSTLISENVKDFALTQDGTKIVYSSFPNSGEKLLILANTNGSGAQIAYNLKDIDASDPKLTFGSDDTKLFLASNGFYVLDLVTQDTQKLADDVTGILPSPSSTMILASNQANNLRIIDYQGKVLYNLNNGTTLDKASWIKDSNDLVLSINNILYKVSFTDLKMIPYQTTVLGNISKVLSVENNKVLYIADNKLFEVETLTGWE